MTQEDGFVRPTRPYPNIQCPHPDCTEQLDSEYHLAQHLADTHEHPELLYAMQERYEEDHA